MLETINPDIELTKEEYIQRLIPLQVALRSLGYQAYVQQRPVIIIYEGWDAAGKGGNIKRVTEKLDPRGYVVHAIAAPQGEDKTHHYLWRFWRRLPEKGQISIFDRSWYGRVMVERIEGFATETEWKRAYREINQFERQLIDFGTILFKFWIHISKAEQEARFEVRAGTEHKSWKLTDEDWRNRDRWEDYRIAVDEMLRKTSTLTAPWTIVEGNCKWYARVKVLQTLVEGFITELNYDPFDEIPELAELDQFRPKEPDEDDKEINEQIDEKTDKPGMPMVQAFEYGQITIADKDYTEDILVFPNGDIELSNRTDEHEVKLEDIKALIKSKPEVLVLGLGTIGMVKVKPELKKKLSAQGIELHAYKSEKAIETYKDIRTQKSTAALFHLKD
jgi:polyphosphate kinase 2 (PPK2 family)